MIKPALLLSIVALGALTSCQSGGTKSAASAAMPPYKGSAAFERMKSLVGKWSADSPMMGKMNTEFRLIAGDSVIEESFAKGTPMEMLSVYHDVNGSLTMTHYCMLRNQPRMKLIKSTADSLTFDLAPTPGLNAAKDKHMHGATYTFIDGSTLRAVGPYQRATSAAAGALAASGRVVASGTGRYQGMRGQVMVSPVNADGTSTHSFTLVK